MVVCVIPFQARRIEFENGNALSLKEIDGVGYEVVHQKGTLLRMEALRKMPTVLRVCYVLVESTSAEEAIRFFKEKKIGAKFGTDLKANEIEKKLSIIEVDCPRIQQNENGKFICGEQVSNILPLRSGRLGFCVLGDNEFPHNCNALRIILDIDKNEHFPRECIEVDGEKYSFVKIIIDWEEFLSLFYLLKT